MVDRGLYNYRKKCFVELVLNYFPPQAENAVLDLTRLCRFRVWAACLATLACEFVLFPLCTSDCTSEYSSELRFTRCLQYEINTNNMIESKNDSITVHL